MMVFMNDLEDQNVSEGMGEDKEHMSVKLSFLLLLVKIIFDRMCGPRDFQDYKFDSRSFGFPFDRELGFPLGENHNYRQVNLFILGCIKKTHQNIF